MRPFNHQSFALHVSVLLYYCFYLHLQGYKSADNFVILLVVNPVKILPSCMFNTCSGALKEGQCKWKEGNGEHGGDRPLLSEAWTDTRESSVKNWVVFSLSRVSSAAGSLSTLLAVLIAATRGKAVYWKTWKATMLAQKELFSQFYSVFLTAFSFYINIFSDFQNGYLDFQFRNLDCCLELKFLPCMQGRTLAVFPITLCSPRDHRE